MQALWQFGYIGALIISTGTQNGTPNFDNYPHMNPKKELLWGLWVRLRLLPELLHRQPNCWCLQAFVFRVFCTPNRIVPQHAQHTQTIIGTAHLKSHAPKDQQPSSDHNHKPCNISEEPSPLEPHPRQLKEVEPQQVLEWGRDMAPGLSL